MVNKAKYGIDNSTIINGQRVCVWESKDGWRWFVEVRGWNAPKDPPQGGPFPSERAALGNAADILRNDNA